MSVLRRVFLAGPWERSCSLRARSPEGIGKVLEEDIGRRPGQGDMAEGCPGLGAVLGQCGDRRAGGTDVPPPDRHTPIPVPFKSLPAPAPPGPGSTQWCGRGKAARGRAKPCRQRRGNDARLMAATLRGCWGWSAGIGWCTDWSLATGAYRVGRGLSAGQAGLGEQCGRCGGLGAPVWPREAELWLPGRGRRPQRWS